MRLFRNKNLISGFVRSHFAGVPPQNLTTAARIFPVTARVDLQSALDDIFSKRFEARVLGVHRASAAFIKELMRRAAQYLLNGGKTGPLALEHVEAALDELLFSGGTLNVKLLGGAVEP